MRGRCLGEMVQAAHNFSAKMHINLQQQQQL
jgi:hypothetical protein